MPTWSPSVSVIARTLGLRHVRQRPRARCSGDHRGAHVGGNPLGVVTADHDGSMTLIVERDLDRRLTPANADVLPIALRAPGADQPLRAAEPRSAHPAHGSTTVGHHLD